MACMGDRCATSGSCMHDAVSDGDCGQCCTARPAYACRGMPWYMNRARADRAQPGCYYNGKKSPVVHPYYYMVAGPDGGGALTIVAAMVDC